MLKRIVMISVVAVVILAAVFVYSVLHAPAAPSETIEAIPLQSEETTSSSSSPAAPSETQNSVAESAPAAETQTENTLTTFEIVPAEPEVRFELDEFL